MEWFHVNSYLGMFIFKPSVLTKDIKNSCTSTFWMVHCDEFESYIEPNIIFLDNQHRVCKMKYMLTSLSDYYQDFTELEDHSHSISFG